MECYVCPRELLPVVESALAAVGYVVELPLQRTVGSARITVMTRGSAVISLHEDLAHELADITVHTHDEPEGLAVLQKLAQPGPTPFVWARKREPGERPWIDGEHAPLRRR